MTLHLQLPRAGIQFFPENPDTMMTTMTPRPAVTSLIRITRCLQN